MTMTAPTPPRVPIDSFTVLAGGLDHPEGVAWDPLTCRVYAGGEAGQIYAIESDGTTRVVGQTGGFVLGVAVDGDGRVYACDVGRGEIVRVDPHTGEASAYGRWPAGDRMRAPNWLAFDDQGGLFVTDSGDWGRHDGRIWRISSEGEASVWCTETVALPNGCAVSPAGDALYVIETNRPGVVQVPIGPDGSPGTPDVVVELPGIVPDGIAIADDGSLVIACYRPDALLRVDRGGLVETLVEDPFGQTLGAPANVAFTGGGLERVVTSNLGRWHVATGSLGLRGIPLRRPTGLA